ncbi:EamA family transporter [Christensenellaceae bacterium OttesenSCG-928-K19]|nr:EamA family transporter [Christensenellaceae bacterium OttesenSCG-928-K19]
MQIKYLFLMAGAVFISAISQILLKRSAQINVNAKGFRAQYLNRYVISGYILLFVAMLGPLYAYQFVDLKYGAVIESLAYAFVMALSALFLQEKITKKKLIGNIIIISGVILFNSTLF